MSIEAILLGIVPIIIFVVIDTFGDLKTALISAAVFAVLELLYTVIRYKRIDAITILSLGLVLVFSFFAYQKESAILFKIQPTVLGVVLATVFLYSYFFSEPIFLTFMKKYPELIPKNAKALIESEIGIRLMRKLTFFVGIAMGLHGLINIPVAFNLSNGWWLAYRGIGFYLFMFFAMIAARFSL